MRWVTALLLLCVVILPAVSFGDDFSDSQLNNGIRNSDTLSYVLIEKAHKDRAHATELLRKALLYSPDLPAVYFELSRAEFSFSVDGILNSIDYIVRGVDAYSRNFRWFFSLLGCIFFSVTISFVVACALIVFVRLFTDIPLVSHDIEETHSRGVILVVVLAFSLASPLLFLGGTLMLLGLYMKKYDRFILYLFLIFLVLYPFFSKVSTMYASASSSGALKAIIQVNEGRDNDYAISVLKDGKDYASLYSYALALKRKGRYEEAIAAYKRLLENRRDPGVYVNLGNCYVGLYNFEEGKKSILQQAAESYTTAISLKPLPSAYYNLSQVSREMLDFSAGEQNFKQALAVDRAAVSRYMAVSGRNVNRFVVDETLTSLELRDLVLKRFYTSLSTGLAGVPPVVISLAAVILFILFFMFDTLWNQRSFRCRKCGTILCFKCEKRLMWGEMCPQCFGSLIKLDELDVKERVAWLLGIYDQQNRHRDTMKVLSFTLPGLTHVYAGRILAGFILLWVFLFFPMLYVTLITFVPGKHLMSHDFFRWAALWIGAGFYLISHYFIKKRIAKGWL